MANAKYSFDFNPEDDKILTVFKRHLAASHGKVSNIAAMRYIMRLAASALKEREKAA